MSIYGYVRVSDSSQATSGLGLTAQRELIKAHALRIQGHRLVRIFSDAAVCASRKPLVMRPQGRQLDRSLQTGDHVVIAKLDRAFRRLADFAVILERWHDQRIYVHLLDIGVDTSTLTGRLIAGVMASVAAFESGRTGERIKEAKFAMRSLGRSTNGRIVIGYRASGNKLVPDWEAQRVAREALRLRGRGRTNLQIAEILNSRSLRTCSGCSWTAQGVWRAQRAAEHGFPLTWSGSAASCSRNSIDVGARKISTSGRCVQKPY